jgi:signal transduction histidine kinase
MKANLHHGKFFLGSIQSLNLKTQDSRVLNAEAQMQAFNLMMTNKSNSWDFSKRQNTSQNNPSDFLSSIVHELKTPLNAIIGFADVVKDEMQAAVLDSGISVSATINECLDYIGEIEKAAWEMNELIHDLLDVGQVASGSFSVDLNRKIDISDAIKRSVRMNYDYAIKRKISIEVEIDDNVRPINLDAKRMKQILTNLICNALKYSREGSNVRVSCQKIEEQLEIIVADQGFGMSDEELKIAFSKYQTIANENSSQVDSFGLGLPITKQLVELQNGTIEVDSKVNKGTQIKLKFPYLM